MIRTLTFAALLASACAAAAQPAPAPNPGGAPARAPGAMSAPGAPTAPGRFAGRRFAKMDTNHDGKVSLQEFVAFQGRRFEAMDADHDGKVTKAEFDAAFTRMQALRAGRLVRSKSAQPTEDEQGGGPADDSAAFARLDRGGTGVITRQAYEAMLQHRFQHLDADRDGVLTPDEMAGERRRGPGG